MSREIKFRAYLENYEKMVNDLTGFYRINEPWIKLFWTEEDDVTDLFPTNSVILMQYTGLKDKKGKEIYEGDVVRTPLLGLKLLEARYTNELAAFELYDMKGKRYQLDDNSDLEVIGNIYENPELIKEVAI
jgi:uncharacterized phage protein (TIGR01671 family)